MHAGEKTREKYTATQKKTIEHVRLTRTFAQWNCLRTGAWRSDKYLKVASSNDATSAKIPNFSRPVSNRHFFGIKLVIYFTQSYYLLYDDTNLNSNEYEN